jgi:SagB-type dehydrogenase family enzyme
VPDAGVWREYHELTKHTVESLRLSPHFLDWANMPDPFRHYEGVPVLDLPADPPAPRMATHEADGAGFLSQLLFYSAAISASKRVPSTGLRYALRVNPSSGNLHPTEFHFITRGLAGWPDGLYHYRPSSHMAEQRALGHFDIGGKTPVVFVLTTIAWREAWKYRERAYRYCLHDVGHAWQSLALAAGAMGCGTTATVDFSDVEVARICGFNEDEWPMLLVGVDGPPIPVREPDDGKIVWFGGHANRLSEEQVHYSLIDRMHEATKLSRDAGATDEPARTGRGEVKLPAPSASIRSFGEVVRRRRSALDFEGGTLAMSLAQLSAVLAGPFRFIQLYLYAHRVEGLEPGVYRHWAERGELELIQAGDQRVAAAGLSLGQDLAGNACVAFSMIADLERATRTYGDRGYRYAYFEAGGIGQRLYVAAESAGLQATGIGAFYDDQVHRYLNIMPDRGQVVYHFAIGHAVPDPRLEA